MFCTNCGKEFEGNFCSNCGTSAIKELILQNKDNATSIEQEKVQKVKRKKICKVCGKEVVSDICSNCGTPVTKVSRRKNKEESTIIELTNKQHTEKLSSNILYDVLLIKYNNKIMSGSEHIDSYIQKITGASGIASSDCLQFLPQIIGNNLTSINADILISKLNISGGICEKCLTGTKKSNYRTMTKPVSNNDFINDELIPRKQKTEINFLPFIVLIIFIVVPILMIRSCINNAATSTPNNVSTSTASEPEYTPQSVPISSAPAPVYEDKEYYHVGEEISLKGHSIIVNKFKQGFKSSNEYDKPRSSSNEFVVVNVTTTNTKSKPFFRRKKDQSDSKDSLPVNMFGFELEDDSGVKRSPTIVAGMENIMETVNLQPGGKVNGNIAFEAQKGSGTLILHYTGNYKSGGAKIKLK